MTITIQAHVPVILGIAIVIILGALFVGKKLKEFEANPYEEPKGVVLVALSIYDILAGFVTEIVSPKYVPTLGPYICTIAIYILISNYIGLLGFQTPTSNYSVTLVLAAVSWVLIQATDIKYSGVGSYIHAFFEPIFPFVIPNFFGTIAPLISMSLRLFGNLMSGTIIMSLVYAFTGTVSNLIFGWIPVIGKFDFVALILAPPLHAFFDLFSGGIQMFVFIMLTMVFIGTKIPDEAKVETIEGGN